MPSYSCIAFDMIVTSLTYDWQQEGKERKDGKKEGNKHILMKVNYFNKITQFDYQRGILKYYQESQWRNVVAKECFPCLKKTPNHKFNV